jgi:TonB-dependent starch-binding outer membrane protein SusC
MQSNVISNGFVKRTEIKFSILICLLFFASCAFSQTVSLSLKDDPIEKAFSSIEAQTHFRFVYSTETIKNAKRITVQLANADFREALSKLFSGQPLTYSVEDRQVIVKSAEIKQMMGPIDVSGKVIDEEGHPLEGVTVSDKRSSKSTFTDERGEFVFKAAEENSVLVFSFVGRETVELPVAGKIHITVRLPIVSEALDETIIQAYGTTTRRLNTGTINKVSAKEIERQPVSNVLEALSGRVPGLIITASSGVPGASERVQLRGRTALDPSLTDDQPLFIIDGVPYAPNNGFLNTLTSAYGIPASNANQPGGLSPFSVINPQDIESIEVLKDADATAIYGSRGANGVILINTKKGKEGKTQFRFDLQAGQSRIGTTLPLLNTQQYLRVRREAFFNDGVVPDFSNAYDLLVWDTTRYTNFTKLLIGNTAHFDNANGFVSGGNHLTQFLISGSYRRETTVYTGDEASKRGTAMFKLSHSTTDQKLKINFSGNFSSENNDLIAADLAAFANLPPNFKLYDSSANLAWNEGGIVLSALYDNPLAVLKRKYVVNSNNLISNLGLDFRLTNHLSLKLNAGYNDVHVDEMQTNPALAQNPGNTVVRMASFVNSYFESWIMEPQAEYSDSIGKGKLDFLVGGSWQSQDNASTSVTGSGYSNDNMLSSLNGASSISASKTLVQYRYEAFFGRLNYILKNRYILNLTGRRDGSSRFGPGNQFSNFWAIGGAWIFSGESWLHNSSVLSFGKLRLNYGTTGNDKIAAYQFLDTWSTTFLTNLGGAGMIPSKLFNPNYHWERTDKLEAGLDLGLFNDRFLLSAIIYRNRSSNQLVQYKEPTTTGFTSIVRNLPALVQNTGIELSASVSIVKTQHLKWNISSNLTLPKTKLVRFPDLGKSSYATSYIIGEPLNLLYVYKSLGVDPVTGLYRVEDVNKDNTFDAKDYQLAGKLDPKFYGAMQSELQYKNWEFTLFVQFVNQLGTNYFGNNSAYLPGSIWNLPVAFLERWKKIGDVTEIQQFSQSMSGSTPAYTAFFNFNQSNEIFSNASYIRFKNASVSYNLPDNWMEKMHIKQSKIYVLAQNFLTLTNYKGSDPETQNFLRLPPLKTFVVGIQFSF